MTFSSLYSLEGEKCGTTLFNVEELVPPSVNELVASAEY